MVSPNAGTASSGGTPISEESPVLVNAEHLESSPSVDISIKSTTLHAVSEQKKVANMTAPIILDISTALQVLASRLYRRNVDCPKGAAIPDVPSIACSSKFLNVAAVSSWAPQSTMHLFKCEMFWTIDEGCRSIPNMSTFHAHISCCVFLHACTLQCTHHLH